MHTIIVIMKTRSQTIRTIIETKIDFDAASLAWNKNKKRLKTEALIYLFNSLLCFFFFFPSSFILKYTSNGHKEFT